MIEVNIDFKAPYTIPLCPQIGHSSVLLLTSLIFKEPAPFKCHSREVQIVAPT